ncbi:hypothetical protein KJ909_03655 [Patescibacteria group bacterium]|nr:hypothetical protein [Patescibacteria group bacterium]
MKKLFKKILANWPIWVILIVSLFLLRWFFKPGFPETHDGQLYLARYANFYLAFRDRHFPVRWAPNLNYKFGYPIFHFNYYTPFILGLPPIFLGADLETGLKLVILFSFFIGGLFWYLLFRKKFSPQVGLISALVYLAAPYQLTDILVRGSIGEIVAFGVFPFVLWALDRLISHPHRLNFFIATLGIAFFSLTHNIIFFFSIPVLLLFSLLVARHRQKLTFNQFLPVIASFVLAAGLTLFFWAPALLEKKYTNIDQLSQMSREYLDHFPTLKQLVYSPWGFGYSYLGPDDQMSLQLGPIHWLIALLSLALLLYDYLKTKKLNFYWLFFALIFVASIFFLLPVSIPVWQALPLVNYVQFPWRLLTFATLASAGLAAFLAQKSLKLAWLLTLISLVYISLIAKPGGWFDRDDHFYFEFPFNTSIMGANTPIWYNENHNIALDLAHINDLNNVSSFNEISWKTQEHVYDIDTLYDTQVLERTAYFPGWEVTVDGQPVTIDYQKPDYPGLITFAIPAGQHRIVSRFTEHTPARRLGDSISLASLALLFIWLKSGWWLSQKS